MSTQSAANTITEELQSFGAEVAAFETASKLLTESCLAVAEDLADCDSVQHAILSGFHALIAKLDTIETSIMRNARCLRVADAQLTDGEAATIIAALKARWIKDNPSHSEAEYISAMRRFEILAGL